MLIVKSYILGEVLYAFFTDKSVDMNSHPAFRKVLCDSIPSQFKKVRVCLMLFQHLV